MKTAIIMAAGKGTRMHSDLPKTLHKICEKPMVEHIIDNLRTIGIEEIVTVVGYGAKQLEDYLQEKTMYALQEPQLGTGHAVMQASQLKEKEGITLVVNGDCPLIQPETFEKMFDELKDASMLVLTAKLKDPKQYGRVIRDEAGNVLKIVEFKDCSAEESTVNEINTGIYAFNTQDLFQNLEKLENNNNQNEYYITDLVEILNKQEKQVKALVIEDAEEASGVNDRVELAMANQWLQKKINEKWMKLGVTLINPDQTYIGADVVIGEDTIIYPNNYLLGKTTIGTHCTILSGCYIADSLIGDYNKIDNSRITDSRIANHVSLGPWAHLRNGCNVADKNRIGNFVEMKNSSIGEDSRCAHLTYVGDSTVGSRVNFGCGVVTVNYDGINKFRTTIKDGAFIGSNVNLIAPIEIGENAVVAAGSTVYQNVSDGEMAIARERQVNKAGYGIKYKTKK